MTAVASPFQHIPRTSWNDGNGGQPGHSSMGPDDISRIFMPRKAGQRTGSTSSIASSSSSTSTITNSAAQPNGNSATGSSEASGWGTRKKPSRGLWPSSKAEPISGISPARPLSVASPASGPSAVSAMSAIHQPSPVIPSQHIQQNGNRAAGIQGQGEATAMLILLPMNGTFERKTITVPFYPEVLRIGRQTNAKTIPTPLNGYFDSKVLSRQHAEVWADRSGKVWIRDVKSSNGTFVNGQRLSPENRDSEPHELRDQDMLELGIDIVSEDQKTVVHHKVAARVEHAGLSSPNALDLNFGDLDPMNPNSLAVGQQLGQGVAQLRARNNQAGLGTNGRLGPANPSVAGSNMSAMAQQRNTNFWLTPVTMEQIVKKLMTELRVARHQSQELQRTGEYFNTLLTHDGKKDSKHPANELSKPRPTGTPVKVDINGRFPDPPAPPPQQPLPEKPDSARFNAIDSVAQPSLRRSDTERPKAPSMNGSISKPESPHQIVSLIEALTAAKKEIDAQAARVKSLEELLTQERSAREGAEERAKRLELESTTGGLDGTLEEGASQETDANSVSKFPDLDSNEPSDSTASTDGVDDEVPRATSQEASAAEASAARLQKRLDLMTIEMNEMKQQMEKYKRRAEVAEEERATEKKSLAEMVESIRRDMEAQEGKRTRNTNTEIATQSDASQSRSYQRSSSPSPSASMRGILSSDQTATGDSEKSGLQMDNSAALSRSGMLAQNHLAQSAPYASILGVVVLGVGLMAFLNGWQKIER
ncbi:hypothetical protein L228DRAFT_49432 [Xylona heveae TC161]|uniref:FHA domain-containing protein n=1 Tax=Xylona heveae (strain CBS 132557 / TC161) TaxID=1328760 RepID=A0A164ZLH8_XYLHT|nr:hypothetical protein L228DRAFT_49432 [Xylona heveae TC161]KZF19246.1 hypothetical protein L228DRAFT_49432 [Xylona heveae TC161]